MQLLNWPRNLLLRRRRRRERSARQELFAPVRLSLRRLEERRVLDVSAAFIAATGVLELDITNTSDIATLQDAAGNVAIRDASNQDVMINVSAPGGSSTVAWSEVQQIVVTGDGAGSQEVVFENSAIAFESVDSQVPIAFANALVMENNVLLIGSDLTFAGSIDSQLTAPHRLTIDMGGSVSFNGDLGAMMPLGGLDIRRADGGVTFGDHSPVRLVSSTAAIAIGSTAPIGGSGVVFNGGDGATLRIVTTGDDVTINGAVKLQSHVSITTGNQGGDITFTDASPIDNQAASLRDLTLDAGTGSVFLRQDIGTNPIGRLTITRAAGGVAIGADTAAGIQVHASRGIDIGSGANPIAGTGIVLDGGSGTLTLETDAADIRLNGPVELRSHLGVETGAGPGDVLFAAALDGRDDCLQDLTLSLGSGSAIFQDAVGRSAELGNVLVTSAADVRFASSLLAGSLTQTAGSGETRFAGPTTIKFAAGVDLNTNQVTIHQAFDTSAASGSIRIKAAQDIAVNAAITSGGAVVQLSANDDVLFGSAGSITTGNGSVTIRADADGSSNGSGGGVILADGALIDAGSGVIDISADEDIQLGRLLTTALVRLTSTSGGIVDGGDMGGADIVADGLALHAHRGVGTANPLDTAVNLFAAVNQWEGGIRIENASGGPLTIGMVDGLSGIMNGPMGVPETLVGDVEIIHAGSIDVTEPILNHGGSHTVLRAEMSGDLTFDAQLQNRGGNGWILLYAGGDLVINHSVAEPQAEVSVENDGAIRGQAMGEVIIDNSDTEYVIIRTHSERFPVTNPLPTLSDKFADPARYPPASDTAFYAELQAELQVIRNSVSPQATNFPPNFDIEPVDQGGSNLDSNGRGIVKVTIGNGVHLETNWHLTIDWGDGTVESYTIPGNPQASSTFLTADNTNTNRFPDLSNTPRIDSGVGGEPGVYYVHHRYLGPPNPEDPAAPIPIFATLRYDAREGAASLLDQNLPSDGSSIFNGIRFFRNATQPIQSVDDDVLTNPGEGSFFFVKVIESVIVPVEARPATTVYVVTNSTATSGTTGVAFEFVTASFETESFDEYRLFMRVVDDILARAQQAESDVRLPHAGEGTQAYPLDIRFLDDPLGIFRDRKFPNGHYRIYLEEVRTGRERLILDVHIYEGRVVPENFREGAAERQPGSGDGAQLPNAADPIAAESSPEAQATIAADTLPGILPRGGLAPDQEADSGSTAAGSPGPGALAPIAAATLPWGVRVRQALRCETRSISRTSLRLRRLR